MLELFRNNQAYTSVLLAILTVLVRIPALFGWISPDAISPDGEGVLFSLFFGWSTGPLVSAITAAVLVYVQALLINWLVNESRVNPERNWLAALLYIIVMSAVGDFMFLSPALAAATFIPVILRVLFKIYKSPDTTLIVFDVALLMAFAGFFYVPVLWLSPVILLALIYLRSIKLREVLVFAVALFLPGFTGWVIAFWKNQGTAFFHQYTDNLFQFWNFEISSTWTTLGQTATLGVLALVVLLSFNLYYHKRLMQVQKYNNILYWILLATLSTILLRNAPQSEHLMLAGAPVGIFMALSLQAIRNKLIAEVLFLALLALIYCCLLLPITL